MLGHARLAPAPPRKGDWQRSAVAALPRLRLRVLTAEADERVRPEPFDALDFSVRELLTGDDAATPA